MQDKKFHNFLSHFKESLETSCDNFLFLVSTFLAAIFLSGSSRAKIRSLKYWISRRKMGTIQYCISITKLLYMTWEFWLQDVESQTGNKGRKCSINVRFNKVRPPQCILRKRWIRIRIHNRKDYQDEKKKTTKGKQGKKKRRQGYSDKLYEFFAAVISKEEGRTVLCQNPPLWIIQRIYLKVEGLQKRYWTNW